jgi:hypothetical protein
LGEQRDYCSAAAKSSGCGGKNIGEAGSLGVKALNFFFLLLLVFFTYFPDFTDDIIDPCIIISSLSETLD